MGRVVVSSGDGIIVNCGGEKIVLDPAGPPSKEKVFVSHAHVDHMHKPSSRSVILASKETSLLAKERGYDLGEIKETWDGFELVDSGHILGSRGLLIGDEVFYTGDFAGRARGFLSKGRSMKCRVLIVESTYGVSGYRFPSVANVLEEANRLISDLFSKGIPVVLMGYPLGKAQLLSYLFSSWRPIYLHDFVKRMNEAYIRLGVDLPGDLKPYSEASESGLLERKPWILISPIYGGRSSFTRSLKNKYGAVTVAFTGWSIHPSYRYAMAVDYSLPLSDHCDFDDLLNLVRSCSPEKIYTVHGSASEFATYLRRQGYDAKPLIEAQKSLGDYMEGG